MSAATQPTSTLAAASAEEKALIGPTEKWLFDRGVPHFLAQREDFELRPANVIISLLLVASFGVVTADEEGLKAWQQLALGLGIVTLWLIVDFVGRRTKIGRFRWPRPGHVTYSILVAITVIAIADAAKAWHEQLESLLLWLGWVAVTLVIAAAMPLGALKIFLWAAGHPFREMANNAKALAGALPLLLLTVAFLFMTTEIWHVATFLSAAELGAAVGLVVLLGGCFLLVLARSHIAEAQQFDDWKDVRAWLGPRRPNPMAPLEALETAIDECLDKAGSFEDWAEAKAWLVERKAKAGTAVVAGADATGLPKRLNDEIEWSGMGECKPPRLEWRESWNINTVTVFGQGVQVLAVAVVMALFLLAFGYLTVGDDTLEAWEVIPKGGEPQQGVLVWSGQHLKVTALLAAFAGLSFAVYAALSKEQREVFFGELDRKVTQRLAVRAIYRRLLER